MTRNKALHLQHVDVPWEHMGYQHVIEIVRSRQGGLKARRKGESREAPFTETPGVQYHQPLLDTDILYQDVVQTARAGAGGKGKAYDGGIGRGGSAVDGGSIEDTVNAYSSSGCCTAAWKEEQTLLRHPGETSLSKPPFTLAPDSCSASAQPSAQAFRPSGD
ncbi:hypothetical protein VTK56DRAFT_8113 [Thermocarpiscus australiensis]